MERVGLDDLMSLCTPARCGCSITSDTLSVVNYGDVINLELAAAANSYPTYNFLDAAERDSELISPVEGVEAWLRSTNHKTRWNGSAWRIIAQPRTAFPITPAMLATSGFTIGSGTLTAFYSRAEDEVFYNGRFVYGASSTLSSMIMIPLPVPCANNNRNVGEAAFYDAATNIVHPASFDVFAAWGSPYSLSSSSTFVITNTQPITWNAGDEFWWNATYPAA